MIDQTLENTHLVTPLHAASMSGVRAVGAKAGRLGDLVAAGFTVPEGFVITGAALDAVLTTLPGRPGAAAVRDAQVPDEVRRVIDGIARHFGSVTLVVRSSSAAEDAADASFAGRFATIPDVTGPAQLLDAVRRCWASAFSVRAGHLGGGRVAPFAVLVQRQLRAAVTGVAFTADPVAGSSDHVIVAAAHGLGAVVDGTAVADEWRVSASGAHPVRTDAQALTGRQATAVARLALRVRDEVGVPQDVEWAMEDGRIVLLQARPITALPRPPAEQLPAGRTWIKDEERYAAPFTALGASLLPEIVGGGLSAAFAEYGALVRRVEARTVAGEAYVSFDLPGRPGSSPPPWWMLGLMMRVRPSLRRLARRSARALSAEALDAVYLRWFDDWGPGLDDEAARLRCVQLGDLTSRELVAHLDDVLAGARRAMRIHFMMTPPYMVCLHRLVVAAGRMLGWDERRALQLVVGASGATSQPNRELADLVRAAPAAEQRAIAATPPDELLSCLPHVAPTLVTGFELWCERFASRGMNDDPGSACWIEQPQLIARLLVDAAADGGRAASARPSVEAEMNGVLDPLPARDRERFGRTLAAARRAQSARDDVAVRTGAAFGGLMRLTAVEIGRRLVERGALANATDAVQLELPVLRSALEEPGGKLRDHVARAYAERAWVRRTPGPGIVGTPSDPPDLRGLPTAARELNEALMWARPRSDAGSADAPAADAPASGAAADGREEDTGIVLTGIAACAGRAIGPARVVTAENELGMLRAGEVLVCRTTDPAWSVAFGLAAALVCDGGGLLSHAAIIAREHGVPAVLATGTATVALHTGDRVEVDGTNGRVRTDPARNRG